eukprot:1958124-Amphidinium_carterae.1
MVRFSWGVVGVCYSVLGNVLGTIVNRLSYDGEHERPSDSFCIVTDILMVTAEHKQASCYGERHPCRSAFAHKRAAVTTTDQLTCNMGSTALVVTDRATQ